MCNWNEQKFGSITINCNPTDRGIEWIVKEFWAGRTHGCHAQFVHPLSTGLACDEAARQINGEVNRNWQVRSRWLISPSTSGPWPER